MKRRQFMSLLIESLSALWVVACSSDQRSTTLTVSAAASLQDALEAIAPQFSAAYPNIAVDYNFGASGALQQQIEQGAPVDVFFSAATKQMDALAEKALILPDSRQDLLTNRLVLIAPSASDITITDLSQLKDANISRFAVGEFRSVPAGQYAEQVFQNLSLIAPLQSKFVFGNNVRSVLSAVESGNADLGMVYATDAALSKRVKVILTVPADTHSPINYPIAVVQNSSNLEAAQTFIDFLTTAPAQAVFQAFGFGQS